MTSLHEERNSSNSWGDWMAESCGVDLFGCDANCSAASRKVLGAALRLQSPHMNEPDGEVEYELLHDELLESLLAEQSIRSRSERDQQLLRRCSSELTASSVATIPEHAPEPPSSSAAAMDESPRKRRRPLHHLSRRSNNNSNNSNASPPRIRVTPPRRQVSVASEGSTNKSVVSLGALAEAQSGLPDPSTYLHVHCRMQKDKGKGEPVGSIICAKGREACLEKLRAKMLLLTDVVMDEKKGPATMKRRKARVMEVYDNFIETRSLIELKMGFLSMTYGVLLRWDKGNTKLVTLVVLRKMCNESFYPKRSLRSEPQWGPTTSPSKQASLRDVIGDNAILQRQDGTEVTLLEPPYRMPRPANFEPSVFTATALSATGLSRKSNWTVKLSYEGHSESFLLTWDEKQQCLTPKLGQALTFTTGKHDLQLSNLDLTLYEHRLRRRTYRRHVATMKIPLTNVEPQPSSSRKMTRVIVPFKFDDDVTIALGLILKSDYVHWLKQELELRRREESSVPSWRRASADDEDSENHDPWDWIYSICVC
jgi:hypothetical protein